MCINLQYPDRRIPGIATAAAADKWHNQLVPPIVGVLLLWNLHVSSARSRSPKQILPRVSHYPFQFCFGDDRFLKN